jgi:MraZ protein
MFRGNITATVDEKGRLKIPADFKAILDEKCHGQDFFITSLEENLVRVYPLVEWIEVEKSLAPVVGERDANRAKKEIINRANFWGRTERADPQGRVLLPALLRESLGILGEVAVMGKIKFLEVTNLGAAREQMSQPLSEAAKDTMAGLGI